MRLNLLLIHGILVSSWNAIASEVSQALTEDSKQQRTCGVTVALTLCDNNNIHVIVGDDENLSSEFEMSRRNISRQIDQTLVLLKSILITSKFSVTLKQDSSCVEVIIVSDSKEYFDVIQKRIYVVEKWDPSFTQFLKLTFVKASFPTGTEWMRNLFVPCATLRLFLPDILMNYDSLIYLDTDMIILGSLQELWEEFNSFSESTINAMAPNYPRVKKVNSGVILMNLTRMRDVRWTQKIVVVAQRNSKELRELPVQTILNVYFKANPRKVRYLPCHWNFRNMICKMRGYVADKELVANGISGLHGNGQAFTEVGGLPLFKAVYQKFQQVQLNSEFSLGNFAQNLADATKQATRQKRNLCNKYSRFILTQLQQMLQNLEFKIAAPQKNDFECDEMSVKDSKLNGYCCCDS